MEIPIDRKLALTVPEVRSLTNIGRDAIYDFVRSGELPAVRIGRGRIVIARAALDRFLIERGLGQHASSERQAE